MEHWDDLTPIEKTELVREYYFKGLSRYAISRKLKAPESEIKHFIQIISTHSFKTEDSQRYLDDVQLRTMEHLASLDYRYDQGMRLLDHAEEMVVAVDTFGNPIRVRDKVTGQQLQTVELRPRNVNAATKLMKQLDSISHEKAEILKVINTKQELHVKIQTTLQVQALILDAVKSLEPSVYEALYRAIEAQQERYIDQLPMQTVVPLNG